MLALSDLPIGGTVRHLLTIIISKSHEQWSRTDPTSRDKLVEFMPQHQAHAPAVRDIELLSPLVDLQRHGIANRLAREQEEYEEYLIDRNVNETPNYLVRLRSAQQAARNVISSTSDDLRPQYSFWPIMWVAAAVAFSILFFLKLRYS
jgi:hypothetical protein